MSKKITAVLALCISLFFVQAQDYAPVNSEKFVFTAGEKDAMKVTFENVNVKQVEEALKDYLKNYKAKLSGVKGADGEYLVEEFVVTDIDQTAATLDVKVSELEGNATLYVAYTLEGGVINSTSTLFGDFTSFTESIADKSVVYAFDEKIEEQEKELKAKEKELKSFEKSEEKEHEKIAQSNSSISQSNSSISAFEGDLNRQKMVVGDKDKLVANKEADIAAMDVKVQEKKIKELESSNSKIEKEITKEQEAIAKTNGEIAVINTEMVVLDKTIAAQKEVLAVTADKKQLKEVKSLEDDKAKQIGEVEKKKGEILINEGNIKSKKDAIELNKSQIMTIQAEISAHNEDALKDQLKLLEKDAKDAANEQKSIEKSIEKEYSSIAKEEGKIRDAEISITSLEADQAAKKVEISGVETVIKELKATQAKFN
ncbi:MAG: hypothetical protein ACPG4Z_07035 [Chitinophagales bacterium]